MDLYHGSNQIALSPVLLDTERRLDFGKGFYLTSSLEQATRWAELTTIRRGTGAPTVSIYEFEPTSDLKIRRFQRADGQWLRFVAAYREGKDIRKHYDLVYGPVANDQTMPVLKLYFSKLYTPAETIRRLLPQTLKDQYAFKTQKALNCLSFKGSLET